jgi:hypothetical protein
MADRAAEKLPLRHPAVLFAIMLALLLVRPRLSCHAIARRRTRLQAITRTSTYRSLRTGTFLLLIRQDAARLMTGTGL